MEFVIEKHIIQIAVVNVEGRLDVIHGPQMKSQLNRLFDEGITRLVLDLKETEFIDSAGMAVMVSALKRAREVGGGVTLVWPQAEAARRMLNLTRFDTVFEMVDSVDEAMKR